MQSKRRLLERRLARVFQDIPKIDDDELRAELTKHACVLTSGLLEVACREILDRYAVKRCASQVLRFVNSRLARFQNPSFGKIMELLTEFDPNKASIWKNALPDEIVAAIDSIVANRHQIAHGASIGLSYNSLEGYYRHVVAALSEMERLFPPTKEN